MDGVKRAWPCRLPLLLLTWMAMWAQPIDAAICGNESQLPTLEYTISSTFIWLPSDAGPSEVTEELRWSIISALQAEKQHSPTPSNSSSNSSSIYTPPTPIHATLPNFLGTSCTLQLTVVPAPFAYASKSLNLFNETLQDTDLLCRLATHKIGRTYTENPHIMMTSRLKLTIRYPEQQNNGTIRRKRRRNGKWSEYPAPHADAPLPGIEYALECPQPSPPSPIDQRPPPPQSGPPGPLEGLTGLAIMHDCEWCKMIGRELQGVCKVGGGHPGGEHLPAPTPSGNTSAIVEPPKPLSGMGLEPMNNDPVAIVGLEELVRGAGWAYGGTNCLECP
jgi:hypothetical protein